MAPRMDDDEFEAPPAAPGLSEDIVYLGEMQAWSTRQILRAIRNPDGRRHRPAEPGVGGWVAKRLALLPSSVQTALVLSGTYLLLQLGGAAYEAVTGRAPPQPTQPVSSAAASSEAETTED